MLVRALKEHEGAVRADFQEFYNLNIEHMGRDYSTIHAAELLVELPEQSRVRAIYAENGPWTLDRTLAAMTVNALNVLVWQKTKDGQRNRNKPKMVGPFEDVGKKSIDANPMTIDELNAVLALPRREVANG